MVAAFAALLVLHGLIHLIGFAKAFGLAPVPQLTQPISPLSGSLWAGAAVLFIAAACALFVWPRAWWIVATCGVVVSMLVIIPSWADARFGVIANAIVLAGIVFGFCSQGPFSLRAEYERDVQARLSTSTAAAPIREVDLASLPAPVQRYVRLAGALGQPRVHNFYVRLHGRIRSVHAGAAPLRRPGLESGKSVSPLRNSRPHSRQSRGSDPLNDLTRPA